MIGAGSETVTTGGGIGLRSGGFGRSRNPPAPRADLGGSPSMPRARCVDSEPSQAVGSPGEAATRAAEVPNHHCARVGASASTAPRLPTRAPSRHAMGHPADQIPPSLGAPAVRMDGGAPGEIEDETKTVCQVSGCKQKFFCPETGGASGSARGSTARRGGRARMMAPPETAGRAVCCA